MCCFTKYTDNSGTPQFFLNHLQGFPTDSLKTNEFLAIKGISPWIFGSKKAPSLLISLGRLANRGGATGKHGRGRGMPSTRRKGANRVWRHHVWCSRLEAPVTTSRRKKGGGEEESCDWWKVFPSSEKYWWNRRPLSLYPLLIRISKKGYFLLTVCGHKLRIISGEWCW